MHVSSRPSSILQSWNIFCLGDEDSEQKEYHLDTDVVI